LDRHRHISGRSIVSVFGEERRGGGNEYSTVYSSAQSDACTFHVHPLTVTDGKESVVEVILICGGGYLLASSGILDKPSQRSLSSANLYFFTPCLIFAKLGGQLRWTVIKNLWAIPLLVAACISSHLLHMFLI
jgi:hypothetical protein